MELYELVRQFVATSGTPVVTDARHVSSLSSRAS